MKSIWGESRDLCSKTMSAHPWRRKFNLSITGEDWNQRSTKRTTSVMYWVHHRDCIQSCQHHTTMAYVCRLKEIGHWY